MIGVDKSKSIAARGVRIWPHWWWLEKGVLSMRPASWLPPEAARIKIKR